MKTGDLLPVDTALERLLAGAEPLDRESVPIGEAGGRVLAEPLAALRTQPPFDASAMDGYAVRAEDVDALPARLSVIGAAPAGRRYQGTVGRGEAVRIFTGAPVPDGADAILLQEDARVVGDRMIEALESVARGRHIRCGGCSPACAGSGSGSSAGVKLRSPRPRWRRPGCALARRPSAWR